MTYTLMQVCIRAEFGVVVDEVEFGNVVDEVPPSAARAQSLMLRAVLLLVIGLRLPPFLRLLALLLP